ncbi:7-carboxy-7-deazaguanine synthase QueE [Haloactinopolyspora alba]|uniref:7-carboxy-7-deazaguanine synthase QueE n=1 Tax=Haloactinopolyspora alba TaxID=648780 RepID=UPI00197AA6AC|nr:7-carboxy-7-deazaguanine synthase QueE [Haloactinopolyspora alba]
MTDTPTLPTVEVFGPTIQGEGPSTGRPATFIRLGHCNLSCSWCDTPYSWDATRHDLEAEITDRPAGDLLDVVAASGEPVSLTVLTGGEPLMHQRRPGMAALLDGLDELDQDVEVETNGTIPPTDELTQRPRVRFNVSPKLAHAGMDEKRTLRPGALKQFAALARDGRAVFKFVATDRDDLEDVRDIVRRYSVPARAVWIMPEGTQPGQLLASARDLLTDPYLLRMGWNLTPRLHALLWPNERSR